MDTISKNIITYFDEYIKNYTPYKNNKFYSAIIDHIKNNLMDFIYNTNPSQFKSLYENNLVPIEVTHTLLVQLGVPEKILNKLSISDQIIFLQSLSNFFRYKGSIDFFKKVSKVFSDNFEFYELFIDFDTTQNKWVLLPSVVIGDPDFHDTILYSEVYESIPSTLVSEEQLTIYRDNSEIILPLKSNLLLVKYIFIQEINSFLNLIIATFMKEYGNNQFNIYFLNNSYYVSINQFVYIWFYIILRLYDGTWPAFELKKINILLSVFNPYTLNDIDVLFDEYNKLDNSVDALTFFNNNIQLFFNYTYYTSESTVSDIEVNINSDVLAYLNDRIGNMNPNFIKSEYNQLLNELLNSFSLYAYTQTDSMFIKYYEYFISFLPQIVLDPKETKSYLILDNFKPFHTEIITQQIQYIKSQSKFDIALPKTMYKFAIQLSEVDAFSIVDNATFLNFYPVIDSVNTIEQIYYKINYMYSSLFNISEQTRLIYNLKYILLLNIVDYIQFKYKFNDNGSNTLTLLDDLDKISIYLNQYSDINIHEKVNKTIIYNKVNILNLIDQIRWKYKFNDNGSNTLTLLDDLKQLSIYLNYQSDINIHEIINTTAIYNKINIFNLLDSLQFKYKFNDNGSNTLTLLDMGLTKTYLKNKLNMEISENVINILSYNKISIFNLIEQFQFKYQIKDGNNEVSILDNHNINSYLNIKLDTNIHEYNDQKIKYHKINILNLLDSITFKYQINDNGSNTISLRDIGQVNTYLNKNSNINIFENIINHILYNKMSIFNLLDSSQFKYQINDNGSNTISLRDIGQVTAKVNSELILSITDQIIQNYYYNEINAINILDNFNIRYGVYDTNANSLSLIDEFNITKIE